MALIKDYTGVLYFILAATTLFYYGYKNRNVQKVRAEFLGNRIRFSLVMLACFLAPITYSIEVRGNTLIYGLVIFIIIMILMYFDGCRYNISTEDFSQISAIINEVKDDEEYSKIFNKKSKYEVFCKPNNGLGGGYSIKIKTGYNIRLANKIKLEMAEKLSELDSAVVNSSVYYISAGLIVIFALFIVFR